MNKFKAGLLSSLALCALLSFSACGSSGGSSSSGGGSSETSELNSVDAFNADLSALDLSQSESSASISAKSASSSVYKAMGSDVGDDSIAGCELNQLKKEVIDHSKEVRIFQCYIAAMQDGITAFTIPDGSYAYYSLDFGALDDASDHGEFEMRLKTGKNVTAANTLDLMVCEDGSQQNTFTFSNDSAASSITFALKQHFTFDGGGEYETADGDGFEHFDDGDGEISDEERHLARASDIIDDWMEMTGTVVGTAAASGSLDTMDEIASADVTAKFDGGFGLGSLTFAYDADGSPSDTAMNEVSGSFQHSFGAGDTGTNHMFGQFDASEGSANFNATGSWPGMRGADMASMSSEIDANKTYCHLDTCTGWDNLTCTGANPALACFCMEESPVDGTGACTFSESDVEHFAVAYAGTGDPTYKIAATSAYTTAVSAATLPTAVESISKNFGDYAWDCEAADSFTLLDVSGVDFSACQVLEEEIWGSEEDHSSCWENQGEDLVQEQVGECGEGCGGEEITFEDPTHTFD